MAVVKHAKVTWGDETSGYNKCPEPLHARVRCIECDGLLGGLICCPYADDAEHTRDALHAADTLVSRSRQLPQHRETLQLDNYAESAFLLKVRCGGCRSEHRYSLERLAQQARETLTRQGQRFTIWL